MLLNSQFTEKQAETAIKYADTKLKVDWKQQALMRAKNWLKWSTYSQSEMKKSLQEDYKFTASEAKYAANPKNNGADYTKLAIRSALQTVYYSNSSYDDLYDSLKKYGGFTKDQTKAAIKAIGLDFNIVAADKAKQLIGWSSSSYTKANLISTLKSYRFKDSQAKYAVDHCGVDWKKVNIEKAKELFNNSNMSKNQLIENLTWYGLTKNEAKAAVEGAKIDFKPYYIQQAKELFSENPCTVKQLTNKLVDWYNFTEAEATEAIKKSGIDFNSYYIRLADEILSYNKESRTRTIEHLQEAYDLTEEEAKYAVEHCNFDFDAYAVEYAQNHYGYGYSDEEIKEEMSNHMFSNEEIAYALAHIVR